MFQPQGDALTEGMTGEEEGRSTASEEGRAATMARPDRPAPSTSSSSAPSARSASGSISTTTHLQPPWKVSSPPLSPPDCWLVLFWPLASLMWFPHARAGALRACFFPSWDAAAPTPWTNVIICLLSPSSRLLPPSCICLLHHNNYFFREEKRTGPGIQISFMNK